MNTYTPEQSAAIHDEYMKHHTKSVNDLHIAIISHNDDCTQLELGDANICVLHKINMNREPQYRMEAAGSDITDNREVFDVVEYDADVEVSFVTVIFATGVCNEVKLEDLMMNKVIEYIANHACEVAEESDKRK